MILASANSFSNSIDLYSLSFVGATAVFIFDLPPSPWLTLWSVVSGHLPRTRATLVLQFLFCKHTHSFTSHRGTVDGVSSFTFLRHTTFIHILKLIEINYRQALSKNPCYGFEQNVERVHAGGDRGAVCHSWADDSPSMRRFSRALHARCCARHDAYPCP